MPFGNDRSVKLTVAASMDGFSRELARGEQSGKQFSKTIQKSGVDAAKGLAKVKDSAKEVAVPLLAIGTVAALGVGYAIKSYADFEEKMSSVKSLSHANVQQFGELKDAALTAGTAIGFSATQSADAEIELVKAGISASDIYGGALAGSLKLAAAGQIDVSDATSIAASTLTQFGLKGRDVTHVADLLAAGADKALGGVSDLGEGLKYIGPVAKANNVSLEQTVGTLSLLAQNSILGEQAGTGLRGMLLSLTAPSQIASDTMKKYGISVYDATGNFIGFNGVAGQLQTKLGGLDQAQRNAALGTIFGNAQITTATVLMQGGASAVDKWTKSVDAQGFATEQAVGKMDNLNGDLTKLKASFQTAAIVTGEAADGPLRDAVQVVTDMIDTYNSAPGAVQGVVLGVGALTAAVALGGGTMLIAIPKIVAYGEALSTLQKANLPGVSKAAGGALTASKKLGAGLGATAAFLTGPWGIALAAGGLAVAGFNDAINSGTVSQSQLTNAISTNVGAVKTLKEAATRSKLSKFLVGDYEDSLKDLPGLLDQVSDSAALNFLNLTFNQLGAVKSLRQYGSALAEVASADAPAAARSFDQLVKSQKLSRPETLKLIDTMGDYKAALINQASALGITANSSGTATEKSNLLLLATGKYEQAAKTAKNPTKENAQALDQMQGSAEDAAKAIDDTSNALKGLTSPTLDARSAERDFQAAIDAVTSTIKDNAEAYKDSGKSMDINTEEGRKNQAALDAIAQTAENTAGALYKQTGSQDQATKAMQSGRDELVKALGQYGITGKAAQDYADTIIGTPTDWATAFQTPGIDDSGEKVEGYKKKLKGVPKDVYTDLIAEKEAAEKNIAHLKKQLTDVPSRKNTLLEAQIEAAQKNIGILNGKIISLPTSKTTTAHFDATAALGSLAALNAAYDALSARPVGNYGNGLGVLKKAAGGPIHGPGTGTSDDVPLWASNGEFMMKTAAASYYGLPLMHAINQQMISKSQLMSAFSDGAQSKQQLMAGVRGYANGGQITPSSYAAPRTSIVVSASPSSPSRFEGNLMLDSGEFLGVVRGEVRSGVDAEMRQQTRARKNGARIR